MSQAEQGGKSPREHLEAYFFELFQKGPNGLSREELEQFEELTAVLGMSESDPDVRAGYGILNWTAQQKLLRDVGEDIEGLLPPTEGDQ